MSCPTCDHTMHCLGRTEDDRTWWWCPRCGSVFHEGPDQLPMPPGVPKLVERCRTFHVLGCNPDTLKIWAKLGIEESIYRPEDRRKAP